MTATATQKQTNNQQTQEKDASPTLKIAGLSYIFGDLMMLGNGLARKENAGGLITGAAIWLAGGIGAAMFGNPDTATRLDIHAQQIEDYLSKQGIDLSPEMRQGADLFKEKNALDKARIFLCQHPSELLNAAYALGAAGLLYDGIKEIQNTTENKDKDKNKILIPTKFQDIGNVSSMFWMGALVMSGALCSLLVKEDPKAVEQAKDGNFLEQTWAKIKQQPLSVSGSLYFLNNGFTGLKIAQEFKERNGNYANAPIKPHYFSSLQLASYLCGNYNLAHSKRDQIAATPLPTDALERLEMSVAKIIATQPEHMQQKLLDGICKELAANDPSLDAETLKTSLQDHLSNLAPQNPKPTSFAAKIAAQQMESADLSVRAR
ncbi:MAG: hypothetical protein EAZ52_03955 [Alphaproteobacteria bacterium]|nr:MAG: hypothetical protein EAZ66_00995 [Alphaproteobacteria bacterium]TAF76503.1 MAG: hypothetical protein EAZ52_03955 [Alphaproteobacteria bacterium]